MATQYQTYYGVHLNHLNEIWGGVTYHKILVKEYPDADLVSTASTQTTTADFLYPRIIQNRYYLDGCAEGHITLYNSHATSTATITAYTVTLYKTEDVPSSMEVLGTYSNSISTDNTITPGDWIVLPVEMAISRGFVDAEEKLVLRISYTSSDGTVNISHYNDSTEEEIKLTLPYATSG